jgi:hypothetical protein
MPQDPIAARRRLAIEVAHEMSSSPRAASAFIDDLVVELVDRTGERYAVIAQRLYRAIMIVNLEGMRRARDFEGVNPAAYLAALRPELAVSMREYARRLEERRSEERKDKASQTASKDEASKTGKRSTKGGYK